MIGALRCARARQPRWLSVVLVLLLFAAAGVPATVGGTFAEQRLELGADAVRVDANHEVALPVAAAGYLHRFAQCGRPPARC
ncbi:MAG: hypothetical protein WAT39_25045, partial [Planctomycetota bacterium]